MAKTIVTTAKGKTLNMSALKAKNEKVIPLGNKVAKAKKEQMELQKKTNASQPNREGGRLHSVIPSSGPVGEPLVNVLTEPHAEEKPVLEKNSKASKNS